MSLIDNSSAHCPNKMEQYPYLGEGDQDGLLPPSSPPIILPSSPLTVIDESRDPSLTMHALIESPLSSPPVSPAPLPALMPPLPPHFFPPACEPVLNIGGSEDSFQPSSPIRSREDSRRKLQKRRDEDREARIRQELEEKQQRRTIAFEECLSILSKNKLTLAELTEYVLFHDASGQTAKEQCESFDKGLITQMLDLFASRKVNQTSQGVAKGWAESTVVQAISKEVNAATRSGDLRISEHEIDSSFASGLGFEELKKMVRKQCPLFLRLLVDVITTSRQAGSTSKGKLASKEHVRTVFS